jgi:hypothetical protein
MAGKHLLWRAGHRHRTLPLLHVTNRTHKERASTEMLHEAELTNEKMSTVEKCCGPG